MKTCVAIVSQLKKQHRDCVVARSRKFLHFFVTYLLSTTVTNFSTYLPPAHRRMQGLLGSTAASKDTKKRFVLWAAHQTSCDYVWHLEEDTIADPQEMLTYSNVSTDLISPFTPLNMYWMSFCTFCKDMRITKQVSWPALRISRKFAKQLLNLSWDKHGHHEPLAEAVCKYYNCTQQYLKNSRIILPSNMKEHIHFRQDRGDAMFVHPNKCS